MSARAVWQRGRIESDGYEILPSVVGAEQIDALTQALSKSPPERSRAGARHVLGHPAVAAMASDDRLLDIAGSALGRAAFPFRATLFDKSPGANWLVVWHQDTALPLRQRRDVAGWGPWSVKAGVLYAHAPASALSQIVALRLHLDDSTTANGPLRILPGTHHRGVLSDAATQHLAARIPPVECVVGRGGVVTMRPLLVHASSKSGEAAPRRVLHVEYAAAAALADGLELAIA